MDKVLDKLGIYDLVAVLLSGVCATGTTYIADELIFHFGISQHINPDNTAIFLILSYLLGTVLQELGSLITRSITNKNDKLLRQALDTNSANRYLTAIELAQISALVQSELHLEATPDINTIYNYCKHCGGNSPQADKDQSIAAFSRSLALYFFAISIFVFLYALSIFHLNYLFLSIVFFAVALILGFRSTRFYKLRYAKIVRQFYYTYLNETNKKCRDDVS